MNKLPTWHYSVKVEDEDRAAKAMIWDAPISYKKVVELARLLKGMRLDEAEMFLEKIASGKEAIPLRRYHGKQAHRRGLADRYKWPIGRYPVKAANILLKLIKNVKNNAETKGLETEKTKIVHIAVHKGRILKRWMPRAFGRSSPKFRHYCNIEIIAVEEE